MCNGKQVDITPGEKSGKAELRTAGSRKKGLWHPAVALAPHCLASGADHAAALNLMGVAAYQKNQYARARELLARAISADSGNPAFFNNMGLVLAAGGQNQKAVENYRRALQLMPDFAEARFNLGNSLRHLDRLDPAIEQYRLAVRLKPGYAKAHTNLGLALEQSGRLDEAIENYKKAIRFDPDSLAALNNLATALTKKNCLKEAEQSARRALGIDPDNAATHLNLGNIYKEACQLDAALESYQQVIRINPDLAEAHFNRAIILLQTGNYTEGWPEYEWRFQRPGRKITFPWRFQSKTWNGQAFWGKRLFVYDEQGLGDTLQFLRYLPMAKALGGSVIFETRKTFLRLLKNVDWIDELLERTPDGNPQVACDFFTSLLSLPKIFNTTVETIPNQVPYLHADPDLIAKWQRKIPQQGFKVGLVWSGSQTDPRRCCELETFLPLATIPGIRFIGLQKGPAAEQQRDIADRMKINNLGPQLRDFADTAAVIANLDLILSIDTAVAHMAGAMAKPVWLLLPFIADWRWLLNREDSPWYPSMRLFRQKSRGDWSKVIHRIAGQLQAVIEKPLGSREKTVKLELFRDYFARGNRFYDQKNLPAAIAAFHQALDRSPGSAVAHFNLAKAYQDIGQYQQAIIAYRKCLELNPNLYESFYNLGLVFQTQHRLEQAISCYRKAVALKPDFAQAHHNLGSAFHSSGNFHQAMDCFRKVLRLNPEHAEAHYNLGRTYYDQGQWEAAVSCYQAALKIKSDYPEAHHNLALTFQKQGLYDKALACYRETLRLKPDHHEVYRNMASLFREQGDLPSLIQCYEKMLQLKPDSPDVCHNMAVAYRNLNDLQRAIRCCNQALALQPDFGEAFAYRVQLLQHACSWEKLRRTSDRLDELTLKSIARGEKTAEQPILSLRRHADPALNYAVARSWSRAIARRFAASKVQAEWQHIKNSGKKITVGYLSADYKNHAVMHLMRGLFRCHNRDQFKIICYSSGKDDGSVFRQEIRQACDRFIDIQTLDEKAAAKRIRADRIDILVDLMGHTRGNRLPIFALKPAPIQVGYLGFLGTSGADFIDYFITDRICTPEDQACHYSEKFVYLPHCYQVNDNHLKISEKHWHKKDCRLPEHGFIFCCFNQPYKIDAIIFDAWMHILRRVPQSVLWLLDQNRKATKNLQREAQARGVDSSRLIFASALPIEEHLARLRLADLALDTRLYNGGATTSNALWAGVPVISLQGRHFVSRMSSSSLIALGLPELVVSSTSEYQKLAVQLATSPSQLTAVRKKLDHNRGRYPLFDTSRFARNLEAAYHQMWKIFNSGNPPRQITVSDPDTHPGAKNPDSCFIRPCVENDPIGLQKTADTPQKPPLPDRAQVLFHFNTANALHNQKKYTEAIAGYQRALAIKPDLVEAHYNLGNTYLDLKKYPQAVACYQKTLSLKPDYRDARFNMAIAFSEQGDFAKAIAAYRSVLKIKPDMVQAHYNLAILLQQQGHLAEALDCYRQAVDLQPRFAQAYNNMGNVYQQQAKSENAIACFQKALQFKPDYADAYYNLGRTFQDRDCCNEAIICYEKALKFEPSYFKACNNLAKAFQDRCEIEKALQWYQKALEIRPDYAEAHFNLATAYLLTGNFADGWREYEWRFKRHEWKKIYPHRHAGPRWRGEPFGGRRLLVHSEQGLGDILQFVRYLPMVKARGGNLIFETKKSLMPLFETISEIDTLIELSAYRKAAVQFDLYIPLLSLPGIFQTRLETIPAGVPYLFAKPEKTKSWAQRFNHHGFKVGLVWAGTDTNPRRACPLEKFLPISRTPKVCLYGLQKGISAEQVEVEGLPAGMEMTNLGQQFEDFSDTAAAIANLDLVISIDTSVAHLAGAMGKPVWLMLPHVPDWRWLLERNDSPWYPTMRLFRQHKPGDWDAVIRDMAARLKILTGKHEESRR